MEINEKVLEREAITVMLEWLGTDNPRRRVKAETFIKATSLHQRLKKLYDTGWHNGAYEAHRRLVNDVFNYAAQRGWIQQRVSEIGRKPVNEDAREGEMWLAHQHERYGRFENRRDKYLLNGRATQRMVIVVKDKFFEHLACDADQLGIEGLTRDEAAEHLGVPRTVINSLVRILRKSHGWSETKVRTADGRKLVLRSFTPPCQDFAIQTLFTAEQT